ncbi:hypothetical protein NDU88_002121 [Pleurodeles waltl]|uniref:Nuclease HARBI1 n=1 Tax=Pleurodeles waltl TaxID=8319 RepID=A0AAV7UUN6_PLEWA|nr:hypothetical protein NDU88_002121 [Pleurodeles waltl]
MAVTSVGVRTVTAGIHRHWLLGPIGRSQRRLLLPTVMVYNARAVTSYPLAHITVLADSVLAVLVHGARPLGQIIVACCMLHNLALRRQVPFLQEYGPEGGLVAAVEHVDSEEEEDIDNRNNVIQQYFQ